MKSFKSEDLIDLETTFETIFFGPDSIKNNGAIVKIQSDFLREILGAYIVRNSHPVDREELDSYNCSDEE